MLETYRREPQVKANSRRPLASQSLILLQEVRANSKGVCFFAKGEPEVEGD